MSRNRLRRACAALLAGCVIWMMIAAAAEDAEGDAPAVMESPKVTDVPKTTEPPTPAPTDAPTPVLTDPPTPAPTDPPTSVPTDPPTLAPGPTDTSVPTNTPESTNTSSPGDMPQETGTPAPADPTEQPSAEPSAGPSSEPTEEPTEDPEQLFEMNGDVLVKYLGAGQHKRVTIPEGVRVIGKEAFREEKTLEILILPDSLEEIQDQAFAYCANLKDVVLTSDSRLEVIGSKAFLNCRKINREFAEIAAEIAADAFEGVPDNTLSPEPEKTPAPTEEPAATDTPAPTDTSTPGPTPEPTEDPYKEIEWEAPAPVYPSGGGSGKRQTHGRARTEMKHDYDQVNLSLAGGRESEPMQTLTLDGEELEVSLNSLEGEEAFFTVLLFRQTEEMSIDAASAGDMLILRAEKAPGMEELCWKINGAALRKLSKSGVDYLAFLQGDRITAVPTEGFLAGWAYDELKSRGTAGRRFEYTLITGEDTDPRWMVTVEGKTYELGEDTLSPIYLTGVETGTISPATNPEEG